MDTAAVSYKLIKKLKDKENFDVDNLHHYSLLLQIGARDLQVSVVDTRNNRCLFLEDYVLAKVESYQQLMDLLKDLFDKHHFLQAGFWKSVKVSFKSAKFTQVPSSLFVPEALYDYLKLNCKVDPSKEKFLYYKSIRSEAVTVFAIPYKIYNWVNERYPNAKVGFVHQSASLIEGVLHYSKSHPQYEVFLYIDRFKIHVITVKDQKLEYYNQFIIKQFSDYIRYIMLVMSGLKKDQKKSDVVMWGYIGRQSSHYNEFHKYIKNIAFGDRADYLKFNYIFDEAQDHHYMDVYSLHLCD
ncbi:MAG: DUF3822 family protein [Candidatus Cyclobacteriaceae bacterium M2_1C_046]